jgi:hypothetical protein
MLLEHRPWVYAGLALLLVSGCGDPDNGGSAPGASGAGSNSGGTTGVGGTAVGGAAVGGAAAGGTAVAGSSNAGSAAGGTSAVSGSCGGPFGQALPVMVEDQGFQMNGISLTADELELYYSRGTNDGVLVQTIVRRKRSSKTEMFGAVEALPELAGVCAANQRVNPDITDDGLTLYVTCTQDVAVGLSEGMSPLRIAHRPDRSAPFTLAAEPIGNVFASASVGADELTAYSDGEIFDSPPQMFTRAAKTAAFGAAQPVPGVAVPLRSPDISSDGLVLFGSATAPAANGSAIHRAVRASKDAPFGALEALDLQIAGTFGIGAPTITPSCSLYAIVVLANVGHTLHLALPR